MDERVKPGLLPLTRRGIVGSLAALPGVALLAARAGAEPWPGKTGADGQRKADLGDGTFINPIIAGDHPDPTILKDGEVYYMTFTSFDSYPGLVIWRSTSTARRLPDGSRKTKTMPSPDSESKARR